jgi:hypothetical protein
MKIALGFAVMVLFAALPASAQSIGGALAPASHFQTLPWTPPASPQALEVSGNDTTFEPSQFVSFDLAVAEGKVALQQQGKTVVEAAAECRKAAGQQAATRIDQDNNDYPVLSHK